jgi:hypothetical protein
MNDILFFGLFLIALMGLSGAFYWSLMLMLDIPGRQRRLLERQARREALRIADEAAWKAMREIF